MKLCTPAELVLTQYTSDQSYIHLSVLGPNDNIRRKDRLHVVVIKSGSCITVWVQGQDVPVRCVPLHSSPYNTSPYVISRHFYVPVRFITEVLGPYPELGLVRRNAQPIHGWVEFCLLGFFQG